MMSSRHVVRRAVDAKFAVPAGIRANGFRRWSIVDEATAGAVHTGFGVCELDAGGSIAAHLHSFEQSMYILAGSVVLDLPQESVLLREGDYGLVPAGVAHAWRNPASAAVRWADMQAPQPRARHGDDTVDVPPVRQHTPVPVDPRDPRTRYFGHITPDHMDPGRQSQDLLAVSASMRTALLVYSGITVKMMVDSELGARLSTMFMVQYEPDGVAGAHDHPLEETYLILEGSVEAMFDGATYRLEAGDVAWAGVGCVHAFTNLGSGPVRWLETQAPMPPSRHSYRFARDWEYLAGRLQQGGDG